MTIDAYAEATSPVEDWATSDDPHELVCDAVTRAKQRQTYRIAQDSVYLAMYGGLSYGGYQSRYADGTGSALVSNQTSLEAVENVVRECVQTLLNKFLATKPAPKIYTQDGTWEDQQEAQNLEEWCLGMLQRRRVHQDAIPRAALTALILGTGAVYVAPGPSDRLVIEWAPSWELWVDPAEAYYGDPRSLFRERAIARDVLIAQYPEYEHDLKSADGPQQTMLRIMNGQMLPQPNETDADLVRVIEGWRLPVDAEHHGRHVVVVSGATLVDEEYAHDSFPFAFLRYQRRPVGFWGQGVVEELAATQATLNAAQLSRYEAIRLLSAPMVLIPRGSQIVKSHLANEVGRIIEYTGQPPQVVTPEPVGQSLMTLIQMLREQMLNQCGLTQAAISAQKPAGLNSGKAIRTQYDIQSERLHNFLQGYPDLVRDICELMIRAATDGAGESTVYVGEGKSRSIQWSDIHYSPDKYVIQLAPVSALSSDVAGRLEDIQDMAQLGILSDPDEMRELANIPDITRSNSTRLSPRNLIREVCERKILREGESVTPEPHWDLKFGLRFATSLAQRAYLDEAPPERIDMLTAFAAQCHAMLTPPAPSPGPGAPAEPMTPGAGVPADVGATGGEQPVPVPGPAQSGGVVPAV